MTAGDWHTYADFNCLLGSSWYDPKLVVSTVFETTKLDACHVVCMEKYEKLRTKYVESLRACANLTNEVKRLREENLGLSLDRRPLTEAGRG